MIDVKNIKKEFSKLILNSIGLPIKGTTQDDGTYLDSIGTKATQVMYNNGFNDSYSSNNFNPVVPNINIKVEYNMESRELTIGFKPKPGPWIELTAKTTKV